MKISEILKNAGITDEAQVAAVEAEMPKHFLPLADFNARIASAKKEATDAKAAQEKAEADLKAALEAAGKEGEEGNKAFKELQEKLEKLQGDLEASNAALKAEKDAARQTATKGELVKALKEAGANEAALELLACAALSGVNYDDDGKAANIQEIVEAQKTENAGLFGVTIDTGKEPGKGQPPAGKDPFLAGFEG